MLSGYKNQLHKLKGVLAKNLSRNNMLKPVQSQPVGIHEAEDANLMGITGDKVTEKDKLFPQIYASDFVKKVTTER